MTLIPRYYQTDMVDRTADAIDRGRTSICQVLPTGGGKTVLAAEMTNRVRANTSGHGTIGLYLVHRNFLVGQTVKTLMAAGIERSQIGVIRSGSSIVPEAPFQVAMVQTLVNRLENYRAWLQPKINFIDEAHHVRAGTWERVLNAYPEAFRIGLTATPERLDGKGLGDIFEELVIGPEIPELVDEGFLAPMDVHRLPHGLNLRKMRKSSNGDYNRDDLAEAMTGPVIVNTVNAWRKIAPNRRTIHYAVNVDHSRNFMERMHEIGVKCEHIDAKTPSHIRDAILDRFDRGVTQVITNCEILTEGFDCPACDCVLIGRPTLSRVLWKQMVGRGMRPKPDGGHGKLIDCVGGVQEHGNPDKVIEWSLDGRKVSKGVRREIVESKTSVICDNCFYPYPKEETRCPECGHDRATALPEEVEVDLVEEKARQDAERAEKRKTLNSAIAETEGDRIKLAKVAKDFGYKPSWVSYIITIPAYKNLWATRRRQREGML